jgi:hypothetical protein
MFVVAATLSNRMQRTRNSVRRLPLLHWLCKHGILREAYIKEYRRATGEKNQGVVRCPCQTPKGLLGSGYDLNGDYCVPNSGQRGKNIDSASVSVKPSFGRR